MKPVKEIINELLDVLFNSFINKTVYVANINKLHLFFNFTEQGGKLTIFMQCPTGDFFSLRKSCFSEYLIIKYVRLTLIFTLLLYNYICLHLIK